MASQTLFTIGHSTLSFDAFVELLKQHQVTAIADVRSHPFSARFAQYNRDTLAEGLAAVGIAYVFLGDELGARRSEPAAYVQGRVDYQKIKALPKFQMGLERLQHGARNHRVALMCAEREPLDCHRTILICHELRREFEIRHILSDGSVEDHRRTEERLLREMDIAPTLFDEGNTDAALLERAYRKRAEQIAYRTKEVEGVQA
jgi:uncharacterized protein (DUF488 family)